jgi:hypothetical protein
MKKILLLLVCCLTLVGLSGCSLKVWGTWEMAELTTKVLGFEKTLAVGDEYLGTELTSDYIVVEFKTDGTGSLKMKDSDPTSITWELNEEIVKITDSNDVTIDAKLEDKFLVIDMTGFGTGVVFKLTKKGLF